MLELGVIERVFPLIMNRWLLTGAAFAFVLIDSLSLAFVPRPAWIGRSATSTSSQLLNNLGGIEQIEFKIYPDGRVEETVRGIRGNNCHHVTEAINEKLGEVVASAPTEELYEQEVVLDQTLIQTTSESTGSSSW